MKARIIALLLTLALAVPASAEPVKVTLAGDYDLDSTSHIYLTTTGLNDQFFGEGRPGKAAVKTSGSATTVVSNVASSAALSNLAVGDVLQFAQTYVGAMTRTAPYERLVTAVASADSITINSAVDLTGGTTYNWRKFSASTSAGANFIPVSGYETVAFSWQITQSDAANIVVRVECEQEGAASSPVKVFDKTYTTYGACSTSTSCDALTISPNVYDRCRIGFKIDTDASDAGAAVEKISAQVRLAR